MLSTTHFCAAGLTSQFWLDQEDLDLCRIRHLIDKGKWKLPLDATDKQVVKTLRVREDFGGAALWAKLQHHNATAGDQNRAASHVIDVGDNTKAQMLRKR